MQELAEFAMPDRLALDEETGSESYGKFVAEPLEKGFGNTVGNALRRVLISSLEGVAASHIKIDGVAHEFSTVPHVVEDVTDIVLNFKRVLFSCTGDLPRTIELKAKKAGAVTAGDIKCDGATEVINKDQHLFTLDKDKEVNIEIEIQSGRGYCPAEDNKREDHPIGVIVIDCLYSPVRRVTYSVHDCRIGQRTDYDRLELEVWTDARMEPGDAVRQAAIILQNHLEVFAIFGSETPKDATALITSPEDEKMLAAMLKPMAELELSVRAQNCLDSAKIIALGELVQRSESELLKFRNFGQKSLNELKDKLESLDMSLNMEVPETVQTAFELECARLKEEII